MGQLLHSSTGQTHRFDWKQVVIAAAQAEADNLIGNITHTTNGNNTNLVADAANQMGSNFANSALESLDSRHFDAQTAAADALGAYIGNLYQDQTVREAIKNYRQQRQEQQQFNDWVNDLPNRIAERYGAPRSYASQVMSYTASDLSHFNDPTSSSTTNPRGNNPTPSNKNPSYSDRQSQTDLSKTRAQRWSQDQQQQQNWDAQRSSAGDGTITQSMPYPPEDDAIEPVAPELAVLGAIDLAVDVGSFLVEEAAPYILPKLSQLAQSTGFWREGTDALESIFTGGRKIDSIAEWEKSEIEAADWYDALRGSGSNTDINLISENTGIPEYRIERIKNHLFFDNHELMDGRIDRFDPYIEIADAWERLQTGNFYKQDLDLLNHEYFESKFENIFNTDYDAAHEAAIKSGRDWDPDQINSYSPYWRP
jgi:hypothetical protein